MEWTPQEWQTGTAYCAGFLLSGLLAAVLIDGACRVVIVLRRAALDQITN